MVRTVVIALLVAFGATSALAQKSPIDERKDAMKAISKAGKTVAPMIKGEKPFDLAVVKAALKAFQDNAEKSKSLYPAGSDKGKTRAKPAVFTDTKDFMAKFDEFIKDAKAAEGNITDLASLKANWKSVTENCGGCHKPYRAPKKKK